MKKIQFLTLALFIFSFGKSQTIKDARTHMYYERYETAKDLLKDIIAKGNAAPDAWYWLGEIYLEQRKVDSAYQLTGKAAESFLAQGMSKKKNPLIYIGWAHAMLDSGMKSEARSQMEQVLEETRHKDAEALWAAARANIDSKNGDVNWAIELLNEAAKRDKKNPAIYVALGDAYKKLTDGSNAVRNYQNALEAEPGYAEALYKIGRIYKGQNNYEVYLEKFNKALEVDSTYAPALYELYYHYYFRDVTRAAEYLNAYIRNSEPSIVHDYMRTDLYYVSKKYPQAIESANKIMAAEKQQTEPRLFKLIAYSYDALGDSALALANINTYFEKQDSTDYVAKDFELKARLLEKTTTDKSLVVEWYKKALAMEKDDKEKLAYMSSLAELQKELGNREREAVWREKVYNTKENPTNLDIYKWGLALYNGENYQKADSVFAIYQQKYPEQIYGYLYRAKSNALIDTNMQLGIAVPHFKELINVASKDSVKNKKILLNAYEYLGTYEANITKDYSASLEYFDRIIQLDPDNSEAKKNAGILAKQLDKKEGDDSK
jgi:tetratricopeptide (TPR) repeat protein